MKKYTPYIFPLIVIVIVFFLVYRWYSIRTQRDSQQADFGEGIQIENLSPEQLQNVMRGSRDISTTQLEPGDSEKAASVGRGAIKYEIANNRVNFTVSADLPQGTDTFRVWVRSQDGDDLTEAFILETGKGGYMGSASIPQDRLPLEVMVSTASQKSEVMGNVLMKGVIAAPAVSPTPTAKPAGN
jgi:hypothetical protein